MEHEELVKLAEAAFKDLPTNPTTATDLVRQVHYPSFFGFYLRRYFFCD